MYMDKSANRLKELVNNGDIDGMRKALNTNNINEDELQQIISNTEKKLQLNFMDMSGKISDETYRKMITLLENHKRIRALRETKLNDDVIGLIGSYLGGKNKRTKKPTTTKNTQKHSKRNTRNTRKHSKRNKKKTRTPKKRIVVRRKK